MVEVDPAARQHALELISKLTTKVVGRSRPLRADMSGDDVRIRIALNNMYSTLNGTKKVLVTLTKCCTFGFSIPAPHCF